MKNKIIYYLCIFSLLIYSHKAHGQINESNETAFYAIASSDPLKNILTIQQEDIYSQDLNDIQSKLKSPTILLKTSISHVTTTSPTYHHNSMIHKQSQNHSLHILDEVVATLGYENLKIKERYKNKIVFMIMGLLIVLPIILYSIVPEKRNIDRKQKNTTRFNQEPQAPHPTDLEAQNKLNEEALTTTKETEQTTDVVKQKHENVVEDLLYTKEKDERDPEITTQMVLSEQVVEKIMMRLNDFEKKQLFIKRNVSLSYLAIYCDTNAKYLSVVINSCKQKDFYNYINELRINYITNKLKSDPYYRRLKVAALANEAGFSSQSKFAQHFKKITSLSPSEFIKSLPEPTN